MYVIVAVLAVAMLLGSVVVTSKAGKDDGICKYGNDDTEEK